MFNSAFAHAVIERAIKTFAQALGAVLVANGTGLLDADWTASLSTAGMAAVLSVLTSVGSSSVGSDGPSLAGEELTGKHEAV